MADVKIAAQPRTLMGRKANRLRRQGWVPANVYGNNVESTALQVNAREFRLLSPRIHSSTIIDLSVEGEGRPRPVFVRSIGRAPRTGEPIHIDFYQVNLSEPVKVTVPLQFTGEAPVVNNSKGVLLHSMESVEVEALPNEIPGYIEVDLSSLVDFDAAIHVSDLRVPAGVTLLTPADELIAKAQPSRVDAELSAEAAAQGEELAEDQAPASGSPDAETGAETSEGES